MSGYIGPSPVPQSIQRRQTFTATASQTTFGTSGYTDGNFIDVYLNGVKLVGGTDYTATNGSDIVLTTGAGAGDILDFVTFNSFQLNAPSFDDSLTLQNTTEEDTDGGRESTIIFKGEQSGGEISTLAEIEAAHDGTADDEKGDLIFRTNDGSDGSAPTEAMRIDSGRLIHTTADLNSGGNEDMATGYVAPQGSIYSQGFASSGARSNNTGYLSGLAIVNGDNNTNGNANDGRIVANIAAEVFTTDSNAGDDSGADLTFWTKPEGSSMVERMRILHTGGIAFNGDTAAANALNDYEEGTYNPTLSGSISGSFGGVGSYVKVGKIVTFMFSFNQVSSSPQGNITFGLPFVMDSNQNALTIEQYQPIQTFNAAYPSNAIQLYGYIDHNTSTVTPYFSTTNSTSSVQMTHSHINASSTYLRGVFVYETTA